jgi:hypothetical protein
MRAAETPQFQRGEAVTYWAMNGHIYDAYVEAFVGKRAGWSFHAYKIRRLDTGRLLTVSCVSISPVTDGLLDTYKATR